ncbi:hypothetical protein OGATHE_003571 [Ogataea polymorpha]|uniref:Sphingoid long-chain base transporter RSB1 n=1 Tax=Ogataea polymorpha TaxID=460523 RepID=A0A9P8T3I3_9ASCO|nr:hypothetical protein OGATHE_003571 [Ogataea polymorpha]
MSSGYAYLIEHINFGSDCFLTAYFGLLLAAHLFLVFYTRQFHFGYVWCLAMAGEIVGYIGRIMISKSNNKTTAIIMDSVGLNAGSSLMIAGLYISAAGMLKQRASTTVRGSPRLLIVVLAINVGSIALYSAGVSIEPNGGSDYQTGKNLAIAGTVIQLALLIAFLASWLFFWRRAHRDFCPAGQILYYNSFPAAITLGMILMVVRSCYRLSNIKAVFLKISKEIDIFSLHGFLVNRWKKEKSQESSNDGQRRGQIEGSLESHVSTVVSLETWESPSTAESTNFSKCSSDRIVDSTHRSSTRFGGKQTNLITWTKLSKSHEYTVHHNKAGNVLFQSAQRACHGKTNDSLAENTNDQRESWAEVIRHNGTEEGAWYVKQVEHHVPPESLVKITVWDDYIKNC